MNKQVWRTLVAAVMIGVANLTSAQTVIFMDDFDGNTTPVFPVTPVAGQMIPEDDMPWGVNASGGLDATWESANSPFPEGTFYALLRDDDTANDGGIRFLTTDDDSDPNDYTSHIMGQVTTFVFDFYDPSNFDGVGMGFGYSSADDLNASERVWRAFLDDGEMRADAGVGAPDPIAYAEDTVHRIFMVGNDSPNPVANYRDGQTLEAGEADVWISLDSAEPIYAFSLGMQNANPHGVGLRSFTGDVNELWIDNFYLFEGVDFSRTPVPPNRLNLLVDRVNGQVRIENNSDESLSISSYRIVSDGGASLDEDGWNPIASQNIPGFPVGDGSGNGWEVGTNSDSGELREYYLQDDSALDVGEGISLGAAYDTVVDAGDVTFQYVLNGDKVVTAQVEYGTISVGGIPGDFSGNGAVENADLTLLLNNWAQAVPPAPAGWIGTPQPTAPAVDNDELTALLNNWGRTSGSGSNSAGSVPEPTGLLLMLLGAAVISCRRRLAGF